MAYTPSAQVQALLDKQRNASRTGWRPSPQEQAMLSEHSKRMVQDMAPTVGGSGGPYDYSGTGNVLYGGYQGQGSTGGSPDYLSSGGIAERYYNFISEEQSRRQQGLPPRPLPAQFSQIAQTNNPLGYDTGNTTSYQIPKTGTQGYNQLSAAGLIPGQIVSGQPAQLPNYSAPSVNPGVPTTVPTSPTTVNQTPGVTIPFNPAAALPSAPMTVKTPNGGLALGNTVAGIDEGKLLAEAELQKDLRRQTYEQQIAGRKAMLDELSGVLQKQQAAMLNDQMPGIYEDLNTRGLLRSSALGEKVGLEASKLARQTSEQLALQGINDRNTAINDLGTIEEAYLGGRGSAVQRRFSLEDFERQVAAGEKLGANALPQISQPSGKGSGALQGALGGGSIGATVGGPTGAITGGIVGAIGGGKLGSK